MRDNSIETSKKYDFVFIFCSMPALTGYFFSVFDIFVMIFFIYSTSSNAFFYKKAFVFLVICVFFVFLSSIVSVDSFNFSKFISYIFLFFVLYAVYHLLKSNFFSANGALFYWAIGLIPGFFLAVFQQMFPEYEVLNFNELKSNPVPGYGFIRASGFLYNPNSFAAYSIVCFLYFIYKNKSFAALLSFFSVILTFSKTIFLIPFLYLSYSIFSLKIKRILNSLFFLVFLFILFGDLFLSLFEHRISKANSFESRVTIVDYYLSLELTVSQLFLGHGAFSDVAELGRIHNKFVSMYYQFGLVGLFLISFFYFFPFLVVFKRRIDYSTKIFLLLSLGSLCSLAMVSTLTFFSFEYVIILILLLYPKEFKAQDSTN
ncbi:MAG: hypothetical protein ACI88A_004490 [Paraglaciecola sp.]|jgi:hypothetical protein